MKDESLSDKGSLNPSMGRTYKEKDIKEFVKKLKEHHEVKGWEIIKIERLLNIIDSIFGDELI